MLAPPLAYSQSAGTPTSPNAGPNPGAAATEQVTSPTKPPAEIAPPAPGRAPEPAAAGTMTSAEIRELLDSTAASAKAARELVEYNRVVPDLLTQVLAKLDKIEDKLGRMEDALRSGRRR